jgi:DNA-binding response OmpR family regulator
MQPKHSILLCEEDAPTREFLADNLVADGYQVLPADRRPPWPRSRPASPTS